MPKKSGKKPRGTKAGSTAHAKSQAERTNDEKMFARAKELAAEQAKREAEELAARDAADAERYASYGLEPDDIKEFREMFQLVDTDGGGSIGRDEVMDLMRMVGYRCTEDEVDDMISEIDEDGNMEIDFDEFVTMMSRKPEALRDPTEISAAFKIFEKNFDGTPGLVRHSTMMHALMNLSEEKLSRAEATKLLGQMPQDEKGFINYAEFITIMSQ